MDRKTPQEPAWKRRRREASEAAQRVRDLELREQTLQVEIARGSRTEKREIRNTRLNFAGVIVGAIGVVVGAIGVATWLAEAPDRVEERAVRRASLVNNAYQVISDNIAASPQYLGMTPQLNQAINTLLWYGEPVWIEADFIDFQKPDFICGAITLVGRDGVVLSDVRAESVDLFVEGKVVLIEGWDSRDTLLGVDRPPGAVAPDSIAAVVGYFDNSDIRFMHQGVLSVSARNSGLQTLDGHAFLDNYKGNLAEFGFDSAAGMTSYLEPPPFPRAQRIADLLQQSWSMHKMAPADAPPHPPADNEGGPWGRGAPTPEFAAACPNRRCNNGGFKPFEWDRPIAYKCGGKKPPFVPGPPLVRNRRWTYNGPGPEIPIELDPMAPSPRASTGPARSDPSVPDRPK